MSFLSSLNISGSGLTAQKLRMDVIAQNIANAETTRTEEGGPYLKKSVVFAERSPSFADILKGKERMGGVAVTGIVQDENAVRMVYDPGHPDADAAGYVAMPDISTVEEMVDLITAGRSYESNITAFNAVKYMAAKALEIGK
ncbi:MAG TPA: flagellar basal body rod protein FlgC [Terriglobales bacterium]|nr:flagellar basal body rod protein FlgC [Terriglobales bacterium]